MTMLPHQIITTSTTTTSSESAFSSSSSPPSTVSSPRSSCADPPLELDEEDLRAANTFTSSESRNSHSRSSISSSSFPDGDSNSDSYDDSGAEANTTLIATRPMATTAPTAAPHAGPSANSSNGGGRRSLSTRTTHNNDYYSAYNLSRRESLNDSDYTTSTIGTPYLSSSAATNGRHPPANLHFAHWADEVTPAQSPYFSRSHSPAPTPTLNDGYGSDHFQYRNISRNRSRGPSGANTPVLGDKESDSEFSNVWGDGALQQLTTRVDPTTFATVNYHSHHHQTSALLSKLAGSLGPDGSPISYQKKRRPGWWSKRAESKRKNSINNRSGYTSVNTSPPYSPSASLLPLASSKSHRNRSCLTSFGAALLRQPWVPTQPLTILFALVLFGCFAASLTTFLVTVLRGDREPLPWRQYVQESRPFPHDLCDSLKPVSVFVGVFSVDAASERRNAIRLTYAKHSKPIDPITRRPTTDIQLKFILGRPRKHWAKRIALEMEMYNDVVVLDIDENMNRGKTWKYFEWAAENATVPVYYKDVQGSQAKIGVGFKKADYVAKADDDSFLVLSELERHLRLTPRSKTYWGYLVRNLFMAGELYAMSQDLVQYIASYEPIRQYRIGAEDQKVAKWMRMHPNASTIHWVSERVGIYDFPKAPTVYAHGFLFPDEIERVRQEGRRGIPEEERLKRGGELSQAYSTVTTWKQAYSPPAPGLAVEEQVEALVEGGGLWSTQGWRADNGRGPESIRYDSVIFDHEDQRLFDPRAVQLGTAPDQKATGVKAGVPDRSQVMPSAKTTKFGKDLFRDPEGVAAVQKLSKRSHLGKRGGDAVVSTNDDDIEVEIYNSVTPDYQRTTSLSSDSSSSSPATDETSSKSDSTLPNAPIASSPSGPITASPPKEDVSPAPPSPPPPKNEPTEQIRLGGHNYIIPTEHRLLPPPTCRFDTNRMSARQQRMLGREHGGTIAVHYLKYNEWFYETALALIGRERMWDAGVDTAAMPAFGQVPDSVVRTASGEPYEVSRLPTWPGTGQVERVEAFWGGARMYGSPIVLDNGYIREGRPAVPQREVHNNVPTASNRFSAGRRTASPLFALALEDGVEAKIGGDVDEDKKEETTEVALVTAEEDHEAETEVSVANPAESRPETSPRASISDFESEFSRFIIQQK